MLASTALKDKQPARSAGWNRISEVGSRTMMLELALERTDLSPRELACRFTEGSGATSCPNRASTASSRPHDLITSPAYVLMSASESVQAPRRRVCTRCGRRISPTSGSWAGAGITSQLSWMTYSRFIIAWTLSARRWERGDVQATLDQAQSQTRAFRAGSHSSHRPRLLSDNGPAYLSGRADGLV